jgi:hypothetical protein
MLCIRSHPAHITDDFIGSHSATNRFGALEELGGALPRIAVFFLAAQRSG